MKTSFFLADNITLIGHSEIRLYQTNKAAPKIIYIKYILCNTLYLLIYGGICPILLDYFITSKCYNFPT